MNGIASRYAKSLLQLASEKNVLASVHADMQSFEQVCNDNPALLAMLKHPGLKQGKKQAVLQAIFQGKVHDLTLSFLTLVVQKNREVLLPSMAQAFLAQYDQSQGIKRASVTTVTPLSEAIALQLEQIIQQIAPCQQIVLEQHIDPALIGGYVLQVEDKRLDKSLRKRLLALKKGYITEGY